MGRRLLVLPREVSRTSESVNGSSDNSCREKSAEVIVDTDTSPMMVKEKSGGLTKYRRTELYQSEYNKSKLPNGRQRAENIAR